VGGVGIGVFLSVKMVESRKLTGSGLKITGWVSRNGRVPTQRGELKNPNNPIWEGPRTKDQGRGGCEACCATWGALQTSGEVPKAPKNAPGGWLNTVHYQKQDSPGANRGVKEHRDAVNMGGGLQGNRLGECRGIPKCTRRQGGGWGGE